ncbi:SpoIIE family protein phosphatase, partial [candidate division KSB1 bacterium]|nr:SpoIIE family protein phosphatase [candidate division KSB1 bacterium]
RIEDNIEDEILKTLQKTGIKLIIPMMIHEKLKGIVCLGEKVSGKRFSEENIEFLSTLGNLAMISLENAMMVEEMLEKQRIEEELALAREIQQNLLPGDFINIPGFQLEAVNISSQSVGGDYYDFLNFADSTCGIVIADVSGKGVPASLLMANVQASFHALSEVMVNPANLIDKINNIIYRNTSSDKFITLFYCRLYPDERRIEYCNAGHNHPFILSKDGTVKYLDKGGLILGIMPDLDYQLDSVDLERGDALIMYTDGVSEAMNKENEEFGENRLLDVCQKLRNNSASTIRDGILNAVNDFSQGAPQYDDITLVVLKVE